LIRTSHPSGSRSDYRLLLELALSKGISIFTKMAGQSC